MKTPRKPTQIEIIVYYITVVLKQSLYSYTSLKTYDNSGWKSWVKLNNLPPALYSAMYGRIRSKMINKVNIRIGEHSGVLMTPNGKEKVISYLQYCLSLPVSNRDNIVDDIRNMMNELKDRCPDSNIIPQTNKYLNNTI